MPSIHPEDLSPFGRLALSLDGDFTELQRLAGQIEELDVESESELDRALKLLKRFSEHGQKIGGSMQEFSASLEDARQRSEAAAKSAAAVAQKVQERVRQREELQDSLQLVEREIQAANAGLTASKTPEGRAPSKEEELQIKAQFEGLLRRMPGFISAAQVIKDQAAAQNFKRIERDAESMLDTLQALQSKLKSILSGQ